MNSQDLVYTGFVKSMAAWEDQTIDFYEKGDSLRPFWFLSDAALC